MENFLLVRFCRFGCLGIFRNNVVREGQIQAQISSAFLYYTQNIVNTFIINIIPFAPFGGSLGSVKSISHSPSQLNSTQNIAITFNTNLIAITFHINRITFNTNFIAITVNIKLITFNITIINLIGIIIISIIINDIYKFFYFSNPLILCSCHFYQVIYRSIYTER